MGFQGSIIDTMRNRQSTRTFDREKINDHDVSQINGYIKDKQNLIGPFGNRGEIELVLVTNNVSDKGIKLGTYGFIKNPQGFLVGKTENNTYALVDFAYCFQKLVLFLKQLELGSCWMGGTFDRNSFEQEISLREGEFIPCITPIGYPKDKQRVFDKAVRFVVKADNKKSWEQLFYAGSFASRLSKEQADRLQTPIEMVRLGPSASNKQPWRLVLSADLNCCHFYIEHTPNYSSKLGYDMQILDMGIAMCQFDLACKELKINGKWLIEDPNLELPSEHLEYLFTWSSGL